jgi:hypothetical protein
MTEPGRSAGSNGGRRAKRFLSPSQKYEIWLALLRGEITTALAPHTGAGTNAGFGPEDDASLAPRHLRNSARRRLV